MSKGTYANSKQVLDLLEKFIHQYYNRKDFFLRELNRDFIEEFRIWLLKVHKLSHNGAVKILALLKKVMSYTSLRYSTVQVSIQLHATFIGTQNTLFFATTSLFNNNLHIRI